MALFPIILSADCRNSKDQLDRNHRTFITFSRLNNIEETSEKWMVLPVSCYQYVLYQLQRDLKQEEWYFISCETVSSLLNQVMNLTPFKNFSSFKVKLLFLIHRHSMTENHAVVYKKSSIYFLKKHYGHHQRYL